MRAVAINLVTLLRLFGITALVSTGPNWVIRETVAAAIVFLLTFLIALLPRGKRQRVVLPAFMRVGIFAIGDTPLVGRGDFESCSMTAGRRVRCQDAEAYFSEACLAFA